VKSGVAPSRLRASLMSLPTRGSVASLVAQGHKWIHSRRLKKRAPAEGERFFSKSPLFAQCDLLHRVEHGICTSVPVRHRDTKCGEIVILAKPRLEPLEIRQIALDSPKPKT